jgi:hypothetical protein
MYVNAKMVFVETAPEIRGGSIKSAVMKGVNSSMIYLIHCKKHYKCL